MTIRISIIVATCNRNEDLLRVLDGLLKQKCIDGEFEIIVVDNGLKQRARAVVEPSLRAHGERIKYLHEPRKGKSRALNAGIEAAAGDIIAFTDDDCIVEPGWLESMDRCFREHDRDAAAGRVVPVFTDDTPLWIKNNPHQIAGGVVIYDQGEESREYDPTMQRFLGANVAFRKEIFDDCGLFREDLGPGTEAFGEDYEFCDRIYRKGKKIFYCAEAVIRHDVDPKRLTLRHFARWHIALGRGDARLQNENNNKEKFVCYFGIPRYLFRDLIGNLVLCLWYCFNKIKSFKHYRGFFRNIGMVIEYRGASGGK